MRLAGRNVKGNVYNRRSKAERFIGELRLQASANWIDSAINADVRSTRGPNSRGAGGIPIPLDVEAYLDV